MRTQDGKPGNLIALMQSFFGGPVINPLVKSPIAEMTIEWEGGPFLPGTRANACQSAKA
jgi:hypothetical protein